jgi:DUF4097 and DUF4098 domain-containing protein YvlB
MTHRSFILSTALATVLSLGHAHAEDSVVVPANSEQKADYNTRNDDITLLEGASVDGELDTRNGNVLLRAGAFAAKIDTRNGNVTLENGASAGNIETRNGNIHLGPQSNTGQVESRNGNVHLGEAARVEGVETRNGAIQVGPDSLVDGELITRNGQISIEPNARISTHIRSRNGDISLSDSQVAGNIQSRGGVIRMDNTQVGGDVRIILEPSDNGSWFGSGGQWSEQEAGDIRITGDSSVTGDVILSLPKDYDAKAPVVVLEAGSVITGEMRIDERAELTVNGEVLGGVSRTRGGA